MKSDAALKKHVSFAVGLRFEVFYGLQVLTDPDSRIHRKWREKAAASLPKEFFARFREIGASPLIWPIMADILRTKPTDLPFETIIEDLGSQDVASFQKEILAGALHSEEIARKLLRHEMSLQEALAKVPKAKREWLSFIGLYPYQADEPMVRAMKLLIQSPDRFRESAIKTVRIFWDSSFRQTWQRVQPQLRRSLEEKQRLFESCSFSEFSKMALLRIEVDEEDETIKAARGGYALPFKELGHAYLLPSFFNDKRYWTAFEEKAGTVAYFPYFDPSITLELEVAQNQADLSQPELDPAMIFKALGDPTRYAIARIVAAHSKSSVELAKALSVSKPTISHHVHILRDAGLIAETYSKGSVLLSLKREVLERLSALSIKHLFESHSLTEKKTKRGKQNE
jgi:ArsR family transcriptional regulator